MQTTLTIGDRSIRFDTFEPRTANPHPAILLLHGAGGNAEFWVGRFTPPISRAGVAVYALHYFDRTGTIRADLPTINDGIHVPLWLSTIRDALSYIAQRPNVDASRIGLVGISLGAFLSLAVATLPDTPPIKAIVEVSGGLVPPFAANATHYFPPTLILHGDADTIVPVAQARALSTLLAQLDVTHEMQIFRGETHWFTDTGQMRILTATAKFLGSHL